MTPDSLLATLSTALAGRYRIDGPLGRGGMAVVYRAHDLRHDRPVALKVLRPELAASLGAERFLRETRLAARLQHPNIVTVLDSGEAVVSRESLVTSESLTTVDSRLMTLLWYTMPLVEGESLRDRLRHQGQQPLPDALRWTAELADALGYAHGQGVIHRDIKPENVLLSAGHALLADFGVARALEAGAGERLTETGLALGTPAYMSPEQALGTGTVDGRTDLYSLGCVLYELLTGEPPYTGPTAQAIVAKRLTDPVPSARRLRETVPPAVDVVLQRLLAKSPADRYGTAEELTAALAAVPASPEASAAAPRARPRRAVVAAAGLLLAGSAALLGGRLLGRGTGGDTALDPNTVAVLPFRITAPDRSLDYLGEGIVDLLAVKLDGSAGPRAVPPRQILAALHYRAGMPITPDLADQAARHAGAGRVLDGSLVRSGAGVELTATLRRTDGGGRALQAQTAGSPDSLPVLVDRLAAQLLAGEAAVLPSLGQLSSAKAITAYLRAKAADRKGRYVDATAAYGEALQDDSTFALAALDQIGVALRYNDTETAQRASRLAWDNRARLSPKGRILLRARVGPRYPEPSSMISYIAAWQEAVDAAPEVSDAWFELGDMQLHDGGVNDIPNPVVRAEENFRRALELDPSWVLPLDHLLMAKLWLDDTTGVRALAQRWLAQDTIPGDRSPYLRWRLGVALGDSAMVAHQRATLDRWGDEAVIWLAGNAQADAVGLGDVELGIRELERRSVTGPKLRRAREYRRDWLLNAGRPAAALALTDSLASAPPFPGWARLTRIEDALFWDGDTAAAAADVRALSTEAGRPRDATGSSPGREVRGHCRLGLWAMHRSDRTGVRSWASRLEAERVTVDAAFNDDDRLMCAGLLNAWLAWRDGDAASARRLLERTDSIYIASDVMDDWPLTNLVSARLREAVGDLPGAARTIGRVRVALPVSPVYWSTYLREGARIAEQVGDTAGAVRAWRRFVALREHAEPSLMPDADSARARLAALVGR